MQPDRQGSSRLNILMVSNGYPPSEVGGVETYTAELSRSLAQEGHQITVFCRRSDLAKTDYEVCVDYQDGVKIIRVVNDFKQANSFYQTFADPHLEKIFSELLEAEQPDLIHFHHLIGLSARLPIIASEHSIPAIITLHDFWPICHRVKLIDWRGEICPGPLHKVNCSACVMGGTLPQKASPLLGKVARIAKRLLPAGWRRSIRASLPGGKDQPPALASTPQIFADRLALFNAALLTCQRLLVPSAYVRTQFNQNGFPYQRIEVVPLGVTVQPGSRPQKQPPNLLTFAAIGPLQPIKGMDIAIKAFRKIPGDHLRLKIYGRHDLFPRDYVREVFKLAHADPRVSLMGPFDPANRAAIFDSFDVLIVPSPAPETFSLVAHESLAQGKPVLATRIGALADVIRDGINGYLFEPGNDDQLAEFIGVLAANPERIGELSKPGTAAILTAREHAIKIETIYRQALKEYRETAPSELN